MILIDTHTVSTRLTAQDSYGFEFYVEMFIS